MNTFQIRPVINKNGLGYKTYVLIREGFFSGKEYKPVPWIRDKSSKRVSVAETVKLFRYPCEIIPDECDDISVSTSIEEAVSNIRKVYGTSAHIEGWQP